MKHLLLAFLAITLVGCTGQTNNLDEINANIDRTLDQAVKSADSIEVTAKGAEEAAAAVEEISKPADAPEVTTKGAAEEVKTADAPEVTTKGAAEIPVIQVESAVDTEAAAQEAALAADAEAAAQAAIDAQAASDAIEQELINQPIIIIE